MASVDEYRKYMAEHGQQARLDELGKTPGGIERAAAEWGGPASSVSSPSSYSPAQVQNPIDIAKQMYELANQFRQPAIQTLQQRVGAGDQAFETAKTTAQAQKPTIEQRYQDTLQEITKTTREAAASEFTRRGIPLSSGVVEQTVGSRLAPQIQQAATQRDINLLGIDQILTNIGLSQVERGDTLANAIVAIQAGASPEAISAAQNIYAQQEAARQANLSHQIAQSQLALQQQVANQPISLSEGQTLYDLLSGKALYTAPKAYRPTDTFGEWE